MKDMTAKELIELKNLGKTSVQWINAVGVWTPEKLSELGSAKVYTKVLARGFKCSKMLLYALEGALLNVHWSHLTMERKRNLLTKVDSLTLKSSE